ncbi:helix-turn-helix domain-containing protein [Streptomyces sp. NPDC004267]|uniref:helix-turn-helix domain-containing protein n=1 Tax=Streptomyces sp. NPDC004267 TaxID=3364694 RepID=UPI0036A88D3B
MTMTQEAADLNEQFEVVVGRKAPYSMVPDWVTLFPGNKEHPRYDGKILSPTAKAVYAVLAMHVNVSRDNNVCWPSRKSIAQILGFKREQTIDPYLKELDEADAIDRKPMMRQNGAKGYLYVVHQTPPEGYKGEQTISEHYKNLRDAELGNRHWEPIPAAQGEQAARQTAAPAAEQPTPAVDPVISTIADRWWTDAEELAALGQLAPLGTGRQRDRARTNLVARIQDAIAAGADESLIELTLRELGEWGPPKAKFERALKSLKGKTPEEIKLDKWAAEGAKAWWEEAEKLVAANKMGRLTVDSERQKTGYFLNLRTRIRTALGAGYDKALIWKALMALGEWSPSKYAFDKALSRAAGVRGPSSPNGRAPLFTNDQYGPTSEASARPSAPQRPDLSAFGIQTDAAAS